MDFRPVNNHHPNGPDDDDSLDHQGMALELVDAFTELDAAGLGTLTTDQLATQVDARRVLYEYVDRMWEQAKSQGLDPVTRPEYSVVAGLRDLTGALMEHAARAQVDVDDDQ